MITQKVVLAVFIGLLLLFSCETNKTIHKSIFDKNANNVGNTIVASYTKVIAFNNETNEVAKGDIPVFENFVKRIDYLKYSSIAVIVYNTGGELDVEDSFFKAMKIETLLSIYGIDKSKITPRSEYDSRRSFTSGSLHRRVEIRTFLE